jgi:hypothetical protein
MSCYSFEVHFEFLSFSRPIGPELMAIHAIVDRAKKQGVQINTLMAEKEDINARLEVILMSVLSFYSHV